MAKATDIVRTESTEISQSPTSAPKTWGYARSQQLSVPGSIEEQEANRRAGISGDKFRGISRDEAFREHVAQGVDPVGAAERASQEVTGPVVGTGQRSLDLYGLQDSNEGILSDDAHTAEDSWQRAISSSHQFADDPKLVKAAGDVSPTTKTEQREVTNPRTGETTTKRVSIHPNPDVGPESLRHAWEQGATSRAAKMIQTELDNEFTTPAVSGVQAPGWTAIRREVGADSTWNAYQNELAAREQQQKSQRPPTKKSSPGLRGV
ncbi:MAG: hypothetical protein ABR616_15825 [Dermatophilaceae bacterium]